MYEIFCKFLREVEDRNLRVYGPKHLPNNFLTHPRIFMCKAALEDKFKPRKFSIAEIEKLLKEAYPLDTTIPKWYSDKWFKQNHATKV